MAEIDTKETITDAPAAQAAIAPVASRRQFLQGRAVSALGAVFVAGCDSGSGSPSTPTPTPSTPTPTPSTPTPSPSPSIGTQAERDLLNFALNILYLEAQFYSFAATGEGLPAASLTGTGTAGTAVGGRRVYFNDVGVIEWYRKIRSDSLGHITLFRELLGAEAVAQPYIKLNAAGGPFEVIGQRINFHLGLYDGFDPYASAEEFLLGCFYLTEPSLTLLKRIAWQMTTPALADAVAAVCTTKAGHAGVIRLNIYRRRSGYGSDITTMADRISEFREGLNNSGVDLDQGVTLPNGVSSRRMNLLPSSPAGYLPERSPAEIRPIYYLAAPGAAGGGFFPNGMNSNLARP